MKAVKRLLTLHVLFRFCFRGCLSVFWSNNFVRLDPFAIVLRPIQEDAMTVTEKMQIRQTVKDLLADYMTTYSSWPSENTKAVQVEVGKATDEQKYEDDRYSLTMDGKVYFDAFTSDLPDSDFLLLLVVEALNKVTLTNELKRVFPSLEEAEVALPLEVSLGKMQNKNTNLQNDDSYDSTGSKGFFVCVVVVGIVVGIFLMVLLRAFTLNACSKYKNKDVKEKVDAKKKNKRSKISKPATPQSKHETTSNRSYETSVESVDVSTVAFDRTMHRMDDPSSVSSSWVNDGSDFSTPEEDYSTTDKGTKADGITIENPAYENMVSLLNAALGRNAFGKGEAAKTGEEITIREPYDEESSAVDGTTKGYSQYSCSDADESVSIPHIHSGKKRGTPSCQGQPHTMKERWASIFPTVKCKKSESKSSQKRRSLKACPSNQNCKREVKASANSKKNNCHTYGKSLRERPSTGQINIRPKSINTEDSLKVTTSDFFRELDDLESSNADASRTTGDSSAYEATHDETTRGETAAYYTDGYDMTVEYGDSTTYTEEETTAYADMSMDTKGETKAYEDTSSHAEGGTAAYGDTVTNEDMETRQTTYGDSLTYALDDDGTQTTNDRGTNNSFETLSTVDDASTLSAMIRKLFYF